MEKKENIFNRLQKIPIKEHLLQLKAGNKNFDYLNWAKAWELACSQFEDHEISYNILTNNEGIPIFGNGMIGYFARTTVTIKGITREMHLPVLDGANKSIKDEEYTYSTKFEQKTVDTTINSQDINTTIMRCLVKNLAMFGLGIDVYAKNEIFSAEDMDRMKQSEKDKQPATFEEKKDIAELFAQVFDNLKAAHTEAEFNAQVKYLQDFQTVGTHKTYNIIKNSLNKYLIKDN